MASEDCPKQSDRVRCSSSLTLEFVGELIASAVDLLFRGLRSGAPTSWEERSGNNVIRGSTCCLTVGIESLGMLVGCIVGFVDQEETIG